MPCMLRIMFIMPPIRPLVQCSRRQTSRRSEPVLSPGAARQLGYILREGLRCQLQALHHRQVREKLIRQILHCHAGADRQGRCLDQLAGFGGDRLDTEQPPGACFRHEFAEATVLHCGRQLGTAEAKLYGPDGTLYAHATKTCLVFDLK